MLWGFGEAGVGLFSMGVSHVVRRLWLLGFGDRSACCVAVARAGIDMQAFGELVYRVANGSFFT